MASTPKELGKRWNIGFSSSNLNELLSLITNDYVSTINGDDIGNFEDHFKDLLDKYQIRWMDSDVISTVNLDNEKILSLGPWIMGLTNNTPKNGTNTGTKNGTNNKTKNGTKHGTKPDEYWKGTWSDVRVKCPDSLWRIKASVISESRNL